MKRLLAILCAGQALGACTTMGTGTGTLGADKAVNFAWKSTDGGTSGQMTATLAGGEVFSGPYLQMTHDARSDDFAPLGGVDAAQPSQLLHQHLLCPGDGQPEGERRQAHALPFSAQRSDHWHERRRPGPMPAARRRGD